MRLPTCGLRDYRYPAATLVARSARAVGYLGLMVLALLIAQCRGRRPKIRGIDNAVFCLGSAQRLPDAAADREVNGQSAG